MELKFIDGVSWTFFSLGILNDEACDHDLTLTLTLSGTWSALQSTSLCSLEFK